MVLGKFEGKCKGKKIARKIRRKEKMKKNKKRFKVNRLFLYAISNSFHFFELFN